MMEIRVSLRGLANLKGRVRMVKERYQGCIQTMRRYREEKK